MNIKSSICKGLMWVANLGYPEHEKPLELPTRLTISLPLYWHTTEGDILNTLHLVEDSIIAGDIKLNCQDGAVLTFGGGSVIGSWEVQS